LSPPLQQRIAFVNFYPRYSLVVVQKQYPKSADRGGIAVLSVPVIAGDFGVAVETLVSVEISLSAPEK
jgi:hypothetical protein